MLPKWIENNRNFQWRYLKKHYGVWPVLGVCVYAAILGPAYCVYMFVSKPDLSLRPPRSESFDENKQPYNYVAPLTTSKLYNYYPDKYEEPDEKIQRLREEIRSYVPK